MTGVVTPFDDTTGMLLFSFFTESMKVLLKDSDRPSHELDPRKCFRIVSSILFLVFRPVSWFTSSHVFFEFLLAALNWLIQYFFFAKRIFAVTLFLNSRNSLLRRLSAGFCLHLSRVSLSGGTTLIFHRLSKYFLLFFFSTSPFS